MKDETEVLIQEARDELAKTRRNIGAAWRNIEEIKLILARAECKANSANSSPDM